MADADCSPWLERGGARRRPHELSHYSVGELREIYGAVSEVEKIYRRGRNTKARAACTNLLLLFDELFKKMGG